ncbi:hypothetical protein D3C84_557270 [compost metagenome]
MPALLETTTKEFGQPTVLDKLNRQVRKTLIRIVLRVIYPRMRTTQGCLLFFRLAITNQFTFEGVVVCKQLIGNNRKAPAVCQTGQQRIATDDLWCTIVSRMQGQAAMRLQTDVVAIDQPGFCMGRIVRYEDITRRQISIQHATRMQLIQGSSQLAQYPNTPPQTALLQIIGEGLFLGIYETVEQTLQRDQTVHQLHNIAIAWLCQ